MGDWCINCGRSITELTFESLLTVITQELPAIQRVYDTGFIDVYLLTQPISRHPHYTIARDCILRCKIQNWCTYGRATLYQSVLNMAENWESYSGVV